MGVRTFDFTIAGNYTLSAFAREMTELSEAPRYPQSCCAGLRVMSASPGPDRCSR